MYLERNELELIFFIRLNLETRIINELISIKNKSIKTDQGHSLCSFEQIKTKISLDLLCKST